MVIKKIKPIKTILNDHSVLYDNINVIGVYAA